MQTIDIPVPRSQFEFIKRFKVFNLIYPYEHPFSGVVKLNHIVNTLAVSDSDYLSLITNQTLPLDRVTIIDARFWEIGYLRETYLDKVLSSEWSIAQGPNSISQFLKAMNTDDRSTPVKIVNLQYPDYSLSSFNKKYKNGIL